MAIYIKDKKGFTMIEALLSLLIIIISLSVGTLALKSLISIIKDDDIVSNKLAIHNIKSYLFDKEIIEVSSNKLILKQNNQNYEMEIDNQRIVVHPGYYIMMQNIDDAYFYQEDNQIFLHYYCNINYEECIYE